jgi:AcrR family transcriptional regulator
MASKTTRANGRVSRRQILDAAAEIASEHGYHGTSINAVSKRSGLPTSSIYWHFENKEDLLTAVINDSYEQWLDKLGKPHSSANPGEGKMFERMYASLREFPDFVRLGLMITLERAPAGEQAARQRFLEIRHESLERLRNAIEGEYPTLRPPQAAELAAMTLALLDGAFVAAVAGEAAQSPTLLSGAIHILARAMITD